MVTVGTWSLAGIVATPVLSVIVPRLALLSLTLNVSAPSGVVSLTVGTVMVCVVTPAPNVSVPLRLE